MLVSTPDGLLAIVVEGKPGTPIRGDGIQVGVLTWVLSLNFLSQGVEPQDHKT